MQNFSIQNKSDVSVIEIFGAIGESWFEEGITMKTVNDQLKDIKSPQIELRVSSLGGSVWDALVIHDIIKMHPAKVTTKILGATASSGTIIALAGDDIEMSKNALFLIHNASTFAAGNADDMREAADNLDTVDDRIISIYQKKTGKRKSQISSLMKEERFIDSSEAKEFGFITDEFEPMNIAASITDEKKTEILNKLKEQEIKNKQEMDLEQKFENFKSWAEDKIKGLTPEQKDIEKDFNAKVLEIKNEMEIVNDLRTQVKDLSEKAAGFETEKETLTSEKDAVQAKLDDLIVKNETLQTEHNTLKASKTDLGEEKDTDLNKEKVENTALGSEMINYLSPEQIERLKNTKKDKK